MYEYLIGAGICLLVAFLFFIYQRELRKPMLWTAMAYILFNILIVVFWHTFKNFIYLGEPIIPYYWNPPTLFNLAQITGFMGLEDIFFMLAIGVVSTGIYELILHKKISLHRNYKSHFRAIIISLVSFFFFAHFLPINIIYPYIIATLLGGAVLCFERHDLTKHAFVGGFSFVICYVIFLSFFFLIFPDFFSSIYNIENLSGFIIMGIPIEEYLYGFSFGFMWAPLYEYAHGERVIEKR